MVTVSSLRFVSFSGSLGSQAFLHILHDINVTLRSKTCTFTWALSVSSFMLFSDNYNARCMLLAHFLGMPLCDYVPTCAWVLPQLPHLADSDAFFWKQKAMSYKSTMPQILIKLVLCMTFFSCLLHMDLTVLHRPQIMYSHSPWRYISPGPHTLK